MIKKILINGALMIGAIALALLGAELVFRRMAPRFYMDAQSIYQYMSYEPTRQLADYWTFRPSSTIRQVSIYQYACQPPDLEYDMHFTTNDLGLVQKHDFVPGAPALAVLGDSFTQGMGVAPWFYGFEEDAATIMPGGWQTLDFGLQGWGTTDWHTIVVHHGKKLNIRKALFIMIAPDWTRKSHRLTERLIACAKPGAKCNTANAGPEPFGYVPLDRPIADILEPIRNWTQAVPHDWLTCLSGYLMRHSVLYHYYRAPDLAPATLPSVPEGHVKAFADGTSMMRAMTGRLGQGNVAFVVVNTLHEAHKGDYLDETKRILRELRESAAGPVVTCWLEKSDFKHIDRHPNERGYARIRACAAGSLRRLFAR
ncbi:MAG: hypothetical protein GC131_06370 [Alphaproteobacteria bacterium]|nr:hypothetical protein [Alphaproteobacteria bacterium]